MNYQDTYTISYNDIETILYTFNTQTKAKIAQNTDDVVQK